MSKEKEEKKEVAPPKLKVKWTKVHDCKQEDVKVEVDKAIQAIQKLEKKELIVIAKVFEKLPAHARLNLFGNMVEYLYNIS